MHLLLLNVLCTRVVWSSSHILSLSSTNLHTSTVNFSPNILHNSPRIATAAWIFHSFHHSLDPLSLSLFSFLLLLFVFLHIFSLLFECGTRNPPRDGNILEQIVQESILDPLRFQRKSIDRAPVNRGWERWYLSGLWEKGKGEEGEGGDGSDDVLGEGGRCGGGESISTRDSVY